ncbi:MAG TPA: dTDP-4-dehydrorhamnose reductase [Acidimicrobiales bacterium]|nr:dTDP-4-dehydrorhamnose reductase [Acidimicrobiales bacterium]
MRVLVTGAEGQLGRDLADALGGRVPPGALTGDPRTGRLGQRTPCDVVALGRGTLDVADRSAVAGALEGLRPDVVVHAAAWTAVDACEGDPDRAFAVNASGTRHVAEAAARTGAHVVYVSTDYVFDGTATRPYVEWDRPNPLSVYGRSKYGGELELGPGATIVRTSWVCGARGANMVRTVLRLAAASDVLRFVDDQRGCPTFTADLAGVIATLATERMPGVFHVTNQGPTTWFDFARAVLESAGMDPGRVRPVATAALDPPRPAPRPANSVLDNAALRHSGLAALPPWQEALGRLLAAAESLAGSGAAWAAGP